MDEAALTKSFDACLLTDDEMGAGEIFGAPLTIHFLNGLSLSSLLLRM